MPSFNSDWEVISGLPKICNRSGKKVSSRLRNDKSGSTKKLEAKQQTDKGKYGQFIG